MGSFRYGFGFVPNYTRILSEGVPVAPTNTLPAALPVTL